MTAKIFSMESRAEGGARLALQYKHADRSGIQRLSCDLSRGELVQLVLFAEALSLADSLAPLAPPSAQAELALEGLILRRAGSAAMIEVERLVGYSRQATALPVRSFLTEMSQMTDLCIAEAEASRHGPALLDLLAQAPLPQGLLARLDGDAAEQLMHQLREIALLVLCEESAQRGSPLARLLRSRKGQEEAQALVNGLLRQLAGGALATPVA